MYKYNITNQNDRHLVCDCLCQNTRSYHHVGVAKQRMKKGGDSVREFHMEAYRCELDNKLYEYFGYTSFKSAEQREASLAVLEGNV